VAPQHDSVHAPLQSRRVSRRSRWGNVFDTHHCKHPEASVKYWPCGIRPLKFGDCPTTSGRYNRPCTTASLWSSIDKPEHPVGNSSGRAQALRCVNSLRRRPPVTDAPATHRTAYASPRQFQRLESVVLRIAIIAWLRRPGANCIVRGSRRFPDNRRSRLLFAGGPAVSTRW
jgi:hypothetical protein